MHYKDITDAILADKLKSTYGMTPSLTVSASLTTNPNLFKAIGNGFFCLTDEGKSYFSGTTPSQTTNLTTGLQEENALESQEEDTLNQSIENLTNEKIIKHFGVYWNREGVNWNENPLKMLGQDSNNSDPIDFRKMRGIYLLYDYREVVYVGQAKGNNSIANRLRDHTRDRHSNRWNRFSWFGIDDVDVNTGDIILTLENCSIDLSDLIDALEGLLIEGLEPRQNRRSGNNFGNEYNQYIKQDNN